MTINYVEFTKAAKQLIQTSGVQALPEGVDRDAALAVFLGRAIAVRLPLPTSPVLSVQGFFTTNCMETVIGVVSAINEAVVVDTTLIADTVLQMFKLRYDLVYNATTFVMYTDVIAQSVAGAVPDRIAKTLRYLNSEDRFNNLFMTKFIENEIGGLFDAAMNIPEPIPLTNNL